MITGNETELLEELKKLPKWKERTDDIKWLSELKGEYPESLTISTIRACRDYHMEKHPTQKHIWKSALRNWLAIDEERKRNRPTYQYKNRVPPPKYKPLPSTEELERSWKV